MGDRAIVPLNFRTSRELAGYPVDDHGRVRPESWTDEYRRIVELVDRWLPKR